MLSFINDIYRKMLHKSHYHKMVSYNPEEDYLRPYFNDLLKWFRKLGLEWDEFQPYGFQRPPLSCDVKIMVCSLSLGDLIQSDFCASTRHWGECNQIGTHYKICNVKESEIGRLQAVYKQCLSLAISNGIHFIIFPEMSFPVYSLEDSWNPDGPSNISFLQRAKSGFPHSQDEFQKQVAKRLAAAPQIMAFLSEVNQHILDETAKKLEITPGYLIGGTYHDMRNFFNVCPVFRWPSEPPPELKLLMPEFFDDDLLNPYFHLKLTPASRIPEQINLDSKQRLRFYNTKYGPITIMICSDTFNPAFRNLLFTTSSGWHKKEDSKVVEDFDSEIYPNFVFVPSYSGNNDFLWDSCRQLSSYCTGLVIYDNARAISQFRSKKQTYDIFYMGKACGDKGIKGIIEPSDDLSGQVDSQHKTKVLEYTINHNGFLGAQQEQKKKLYGLARRIFGESTMEHGGRSLKNRS